MSDVPSLRLQFLVRDVLRLIMDFLPAKDVMSVASLSELLRQIGRDSMRVRFGQTLSHHLRANPTLFWDCLSQARGVIVGGVCLSWYTKQGTADLRVDDLHILVTSKNTSKVHTFLISLPTFIRTETLSVPEFDRKTYNSKRTYTFQVSVQFPHRNSHVHIFNVEPHHGHQSLHKCSIW